MKLRIISGNKGGVGKSFVTIMLFDYLVRHNKNFLVGDAEKAKGQATTWNVLRNYVNVDDIKGWKLGTSEGFEILADDIQRYSKEDVVILIDTGASMMDSLVANIVFLAEAQDDLGVDVGVIFIASPLPDTVAAAREYLRAQKELQHPLKTKFLLTSPTEYDQGAYAISKDEKIQAAIPQRNGTTIFLGPVRQDYFDFIMKDFKLPHAMLQDQTVGWGFRKKLSMWLNTTFDPIAASIFEE